MTSSRPVPDPFLDLTDEAALESERQARAERRARQDLAHELATWAGTMRDLAERPTAVVVRTAGGATRAGTLVGAGVDHLVLRAGDALVLLREDVVASVLPQPGLPAPAAAGDRDPSRGRLLGEVLRRVAEDHRKLSLGFGHDAALLVGEVVGFGDDVVTLRLDGSSRGTAYVRLTSVREAVLT